MGRPGCRRCTHADRVAGGGRRQWPGEGAAVGKERERKGQKVGLQGLQGSGKERLRAAARRSSQLQAMQVKSVVRSRSVSRSSELRSCCWARLAPRQPLSLSSSLSSAKTWTGPGNPVMSAPVTCPRPRQRARPRRDSAATRIIIINQTVDHRCWTCVQKLLPSTSRSPALRSATSGSPNQCSGGSFTGPFLRMRVTSACTHPSPQTRVPAVVRITRSCPFTGESVSTKTML